MLGFLLSYRAVNSWTNGDSRAAVPSINVILFLVINPLEKLGTILQDNPTAMTLEGATYYAPKDFLGIKKFSFSDFPLWLASLIVL
jgi:hypothetical protein